METRTKNMIVGGALGAIGVLLLGKAPALAAKVASSPASRDRGEYARANVVVSPVRRADRGFDDRPGRGEYGRRRRRRRRGRGRGY